MTVKVQDIAVWLQPTVIKVCTKRL